MVNEHPKFLEILVELIIEAEHAGFICALSEDCPSELRATASCVLGSEKAHSFNEWLTQYHSGDQYLICPPDINPLEDGTTSLLQRLRDEIDEILKIRREKGI